MNLARLYLETHPTLIFETLKSDLTKPFEEDMNYTPYRKFHHQIYGKLELLKENSTNRLIMAISEQLDSVEATQKSIALIKARLALNQPNLLFLFDFSVQRIQNFCSTNFVVTKFLEFPLTNLSKDIKEKLIKEEYFTQIELSNLLSQMLNLLSQLHLSHVYHGNISTVSIQHRKANQFFVLLDHFDGGKNLADFHMRQVSDTSEVFMSPELYRQIKGEVHPNPIDPYKNDLFGLGMVILSTGLLKSVQHCYDPNEFNRQTLDRLIEEFKTRYGLAQSPLTQTLLILLEEKPEKRLEAKLLKEQFKINLNKSENDKLISKLTDFSEISAITIETKPNRTLLKNIKSSSVLSTPQFIGTFSNNPIGCISVDIPNIKVQPTDNFEVKRSASSLVAIKYDNFFEKVEHVIYNQNKTPLKRVFEPISSTPIQTKVGILNYQIYSPFVHQSASVPKKSIDNFSDVKPVQKIHRLSQLGVESGQPNHISPYTNHYYINQNKELRHPHVYESVENYNTNNQKIIQPVNNFEFPKIGIQRTSQIQIPNTLKVPIINRIYRNNLPEEKNNKLHYQSFKVLDPIKIVDRQIVPRINKLNLPPKEFKKTNLKVGNLRINDLFFKSVYGASNGPKIIEERVFKAGATQTIGKKQLYVPSNIFSKGKLGVK